MKVFITGTAGFIGFHLARRLLTDGHSVTGFDGVTDYYDPALKRVRLAILSGYAGFRQCEGMLEDAALLTESLARSDADIVAHLAAQPGVRYSLENPSSYISSNVVGTANLLEAVRAHRVRHLVFASTSSVYGGNRQVPYSEADHTDTPLSLYAATKKAGEALVHSYAHLWSIPATCVRFFTVYGPYGRPDMALLKFARAIEAGEPIDVYGHGKLVRDFTYVDDLVEAMAAILGKPPGRDDFYSHDSLSPVAPFRVVNIGGGHPVQLLDFIAALERALGRKAVINMLPAQPGEANVTEADTGLLSELVGRVPSTPLSEGIEKFVEWFRDYEGRGR